MALSWKRQRRSAGVTAPMSTTNHSLQNQIEMSVTVTFFSNIFHFCKFKRLRLAHVIESFTKSLSTKRLRQDLVRAQRCCRPYLTCLNSERATLGRPFYCRLQKSTNPELCSLTPLLARIPTPRRPCRDGDRFRRPHRPSSASNECC